MTEPTTPTPRTDAVLQKVRARLATCAPSLANLQAIQEMAILTLAENGKRLERELADETRNADVMSHAIFGEGGWQDVAIGLRRELAQMTAERDEYHTKWAVSAMDWQDMVEMRDEARMEAVTLTDQLTEARKALNHCLSVLKHHHMIRAGIPTLVADTERMIASGKTADAGEGA